MAMVKQLELTEKNTQKPKPKPKPKPMIVYSPKSSENSWFNLWIKVKTKEIS